jgi:DNA-directed RNA polymerase subunit beta'
MLRSKFGCQKINESKEKAQKSTNHGGMIETSPGRVIFNDILNPRMSFYNLPMGSKDLARVISDCYLELGRRETIKLLDSMKRTGFREATRSGLSFGANDMVTAPNKDEVISDSETKGSASSETLRSRNYHEPGAL